MGLQVQFLNASSSHEINAGSCHRAKAAAFH
jgi:hypothetical protein